MSKKRTIKLEFEYVARLCKSDDERIHGGTSYFVKPLQDHDFWNIIFDVRDDEGFAAVSNIFEELPDDVALRIVALRLHDFATGEAYAHGLDTKVSKEADFINEKGKKITVSVPEMKPL